MGKYQTIKDTCRAYFHELEQCTTAQTQSVLDKYVHSDFNWIGVYPFMELKGAQALAEDFWNPLKQSMQRMQRRQDVFMAGTGTLDGKDWVCSMGQFMGLFDQDFLGIRRTRKMQHLQYCEFVAFKDGKISDISLFVDLVGFMKEAGQYPLMAETGQYFVYPGPRDHNGLLFQDNDDPAFAELTAQSFDTVRRMGDDLYSIDGTHLHPPELLAKTWDEGMIWYGPCGVGASYTIPRYQEQHQAPFRDLLSNTGECANGIQSQAYFAEGNFVCLYGDIYADNDGGWLGLTGAGQRCIIHFDLDVYYCKDGKILENWCLFDIPYWLKQQGVDLFARTEQIQNYK